MGRELKRVPMGFDWPLNQRWSGYVNPHYARCPTCDGDGATLASQRLSDLVSLLMLSGDDAKRGKCHPYFTGGALFRTNGKTCGPDMAELTQALAGRESSFLGHDACDRWTAVNKIIAAAGLPEGWGTCPDCDGQGIPRDKYAAYEAWERTEPPKGDGYQVWETVSEGSPISPVFATPEELARHMATTRWGADKGTSYEQWMRFILGPGWAASMIGDANGIRTGVQAL